MAVTRLSADSGGGNMDVVLPEDAANLSVTVRTGGGNITVDVGSGIRGRNTVEAGSGARVHAASGLGKVIVDPRFDRLDTNTYQSPGYDGAADKVEITLKSGAGNVSVNTK